MTTESQPTPGLNNPQQAVNLLIQGVQVAQQRGAFHLEEAGALRDAVNLLTGTTQGPNVFAVEPEAPNADEPTAQQENTTSKKKAAKS